MKKEIGLVYFCLHFVHIKHGLDMQKVESQNPSPNPCINMFLQASHRPNLLLLAPEYIRLILFFPYNFFLIVLDRTMKINTFFPYSNFYNPTTVGL